MAHRLSPQASDDLDEIAYYIASVTGDIDRAARLISEITRRFVTLSTYPHLGRARDADLGPGRRSHVVDQFVIIYRLDGDDVVVLRVIHGRRDIAAAF